MTTPSPTNRTPSPTHRTPDKEVDLTELLNIFEVKPVRRNKIDFH